METIEKCLKQLIQDPYNDLINFDLAMAYEAEKQFAASVSYYLRCAEFTDDLKLSSEALLRGSICVSKQKNRDEKEIYMIKHAITASPNSLEPYYIASLYYSWRGNWMDSYLNACLGINILEKNKQETPFKTKFNYSHLNLYYQKAYSGVNIGKLNESRKIYIEILNKFKPVGNQKSFILNKLHSIPTPFHDPIYFEENKLNKLRFKFDDCDKISHNNSQIYQDIFVLSLTNGKKNGSYLEIGAGNFKKGNNSFLLETQFDWKGISIDYNTSLVKNFNNNRKNKCICADATKVNYSKLISENYSTSNIDYLQLDCDPANITFDILQKIPFDKFKFGVITYEHDFYNDITGTYREKSRKILTDKGYKLLCGNISPYKDKYPFEDWWIHPDLIEERIYKLFERDSDKPINGEKYMLTKSKYIPDKIFDIDKKLYTLNNYHKNTPATFKLFKTCNVCNCIRRGFRWEEHQHDIIDKYLNENSIALEAGSHIGTIAVKLAKKCKFTYCFEPIKNTYDLLEYNLNKNCESSKFKLFNKGLGECIKKEKICWISTEGSGGVGLTNNFFEPSQKPTHNNGCSIPIDVISIDSLHLAKLDYIKIDVEGYEEHVINGGINTISKCRPIILLECYESFDPLKKASIEFVEKKYKILIDMGYKIQHIWNADFLLIPLKQQHKTLLTFGTNNLFKNQKSRFKKQAQKINFFDSIIIEDESTIKDLMKPHEEFIKNNPRGYGYWLWKPYIIKKLMQNSRPNDILFYLDCGSSIINNNIEKLNDYTKILNEKDIIVFENPDHITKKFMKLNVVSEFEMNEDILNKFIIEGGCIIIKKTPFSMNFINKWIDSMTKKNYSLLNDDLLNLTQNKEFCEHRHDQSLLTYLSRSHSDKVFIGDGLQELYNNGPFFHSRLTDNGPRQYAKPLPSIKTNNIKITITEKNDKLSIKHNFNNPNVIVIDDFYKNPDEMRKYALSLTYEPPENHGAVGYRCEKGRKIIDGTKEYFERLLNGKISNGKKLGQWGYSTNGCFQWCNAKVPIVYHADSQQYAAIIYLTPDAPPGCGTSFFRHKRYKIRDGSVFSKPDWYRSSLNYKEPHLDKTEWETVDSVGNVYNRLVIFNGRNIHAVTEYFGENIENSRLFQLFFFNIN